MADTTTAAATPADDAGTVPTASAGSPPAAPTPAGIPTLPAFLAGAGIETPDGAQTPSGTATPPPADSPPAKPDPEDDDKPEGTAPPPAPDPSKPEDDEETGTVAEDGKIILGGYEKSVLQKMEEAGLDKNVIGRAKAAFRREIQRKMLIAAKETELAERDAKIKTLDESLAANAEKSTIAPSGPLAHLQTIEDLHTEKTKATKWLQWSEAHPADAVALFKDDDRATADEQLAWYKQQQLRFLEAADEQEKVITARTEARKNVRASAPELFDPKTDAGKFRQELYAGDPRLRPDYDQLIADAAKGRKIREDEARGEVKYIRLPLKDKPAPNGNGHAPKEKANGVAATKQEPYTLPPSNGRIPVTPAAADRRRELFARAATEAVSIEDIMDAQQATAAR